MVNSQARKPAVAVEVFVAHVASLDDSTRVPTERGKLNSAKLTAIGSHAGAGTYDEIGSTHASMTCTERVSALAVTAVPRMPGMLDHLRDKGKFTM